MCPDITIPSIGNLVIRKPTRTNLFCGRADIPLNRVLNAIAVLRGQECTGYVLSLSDYNLLDNIFMVRYSIIANNGLLPLFVQCLNVAIPQLGNFNGVNEDITAITVADITYVIFNLPLQYHAIVNIIISAMYASNGVLLIEDLGHGLHHSLYEPLMKALDTISKECNVQVFATTQSRELVVAAHTVHSNGDNYELTYYRLDRINSGDIEAVRYGEKTLGAALDFDFEIR